MSISKKKANKVFKYVEEYGKREAMDTYKISSDTLSRYLRAADKAPDTTDKLNFSRTSKTSAHLELDSLTVNTLDKALEIGEVDLTEWAVERYTVGSWQVTLKIKKKIGEDKDGRPITEDVPKVVTMYKVQVWLKKLKEAEFIFAIKNLISELPKMKTPTNRHNKKTDYMLEVALMDVHFGMLAWSDETVNDYDLKIAENMFLYAVRDLLEKTKGFNISKIVFPLGNDFLHIDDQSNSTPKNNNPLDTDSRLIKIYTAAKKAVIKAIDYCREVAPTHIVWVPGNHDPNLSYYLTDVIGEVFSEDKNVTVDVSPKYRKFYAWGEGLLVYTHGDQEPIRDLPLIVASEEKDLWAKSTYREIHIGHKHKKKELRYVSVDTNPGTVVRTIPSIATQDAWHYRKGYMRGYYAAESYLWDKKYGVIGQFTSYVDYKDKKMTGSGS